MNDDLAAARGVTSVEEAKLDAALTGSPGRAGGGDRRRGRRGPARRGRPDAARAGMEAGFAAACWMIAVAAALGAIMLPPSAGLRRRRAQATGRHVAVTTPTDFHELNRLVF